MSGYTDDIITSGGVLEAGLAFCEAVYSIGAGGKVREVLDAKMPVAKVAGSELGMAWL
jgi:hypothetical protein